MYDEADLFLDAQDSVWDAVCLELTEGEKVSHWMWFIFPQLAALGRSHMSQLYGLHDLAEAVDYLSDADLRQRLEHVAALMLTHEGQPVEAILGTVDAQKLQSSMTLFSRVDGASPVFHQVLEAFFSGQLCDRTLMELDAG